MWGTMMGRYRYIITFIFLLILSVDIGLLYADEDWAAYDVQWKHRNPAVRLEILNRSLKHFQNALSYVKHDDLGTAEQYAQDALKVVPQFAEAYLLLAEINKIKGKARKAKGYQKKAHSFSSSVSIIKEREYLLNNLERLQGQYTPSRTLDRLVFFLLFIAGYGIIIFLIVTSGLLTSVSMKVRRMTRLVGERKEQGTHIIVGDFPGEEKETLIPWYGRLIIYLVPFLLCFGVSILCGAQTKRDIFIFTFFPGLFIAVILHKLFFSDDDFIPPQKFPSAQ